MAGRGPAPKADRANKRDAPKRGEVTPAEQVGWRHGEVPAPPDGLKAESVLAWSTWMGAWFAAFWTPADVPGLNLVIGLYDQVQRGEFQRSAELRMAMDTYGITPKGQQDRRWAPPAEEKPKPASGTGGRYSHLQVV